MAKRTAEFEMTRSERVAGTVFFLLYLFVLPLAAPRIIAYAGRLLDVEISQGLSSAIYYYAVFAVTILIFHRYIGKTSAAFAGRLGLCCRTALFGLIAHYGLNELVFRLTRTFLSGRVNLNDAAVSSQFRDAPRVTMLIVLALAPFVEEVLFRGLAFGNLRKQSRPIAYVVSCLLFALLHVWQFALTRQDATYFWLMIQYLVPGLVLAWAYDRTDTLWTGVLIHVALNALDVLAMK